MEILISILGNFFATITALLTWYLIDSVKKYNKHRKLQRDFNTLYQIFKNWDNDKRNINSTIINLLINEITAKNVLKVLKMEEQKEDPGYRFVNQDYWLRIITAYKGDDILLEGPDGEYDFKNPDTNPEALKGFLKYFEDQCKSKEIKLKI